MVEFSDPHWSADVHWPEFYITYISHTSMFNYAQHTLQVV